MVYIQAPQTLQAHETPETSSTLQASGISKAPQSTQSHETPVTPQAPK